MAMEAVSTSRISPTMMMLGACRSMARSAAAKVMPISLFTATWFTPGSWYSTGSSTVISLRSGLLIVFRQA